MLQAASASSEHKGFAQMLGLYNASLRVKFVGPSPPFISKHVSHLNVTVEELPTFAAQQIFVRCARRKHQLTKVQAGRILAWHQSPGTQWAIPQSRGLW